MNVIPVRFHDSHKCPPGSLAWHAAYGLVDVLSTDGWSRQVRSHAAPGGGSTLHTVDVRELEGLCGGRSGSGQAPGCPGAAALHEWVESDGAELAELRAWETCLTCDWGED